MWNEFITLPIEALITIFFIFGCLLGSFANVIVYRLPEGDSVIKPASHCFSCKNKIKWFDNIPIFSWFLLRGRCRFCKKLYSIRYPFVEFLTGLLFALSFYFIGFQWFLCEFLVFVFGLVVVSFIDFDHMILPDEFTLGGILLGLLGALINPDRSFWDALIGVLLGGGFLWFMAYAYFLLSKNEGMGGGDIKLLAWIGALLGWKAIPFIILFSALSGTIVGLLVAMKSKDGLKTAIPFGPYLAFGAVFYQLGGKEWAINYFNLFLPGF